MLKNIAAFATGLTLLVSPLVVSAQSMGDLQAQIQALLAKISALQGQSQPTSTSPQPDDYGTGNPNTGVYCPRLSVTLQKGSRDATTGGQVSELQTFLTDYYNLDENIVVGGYFGNITQRYVVQFQSEQGLPAYGIAGTLTRAKIAGVCGGQTIPIPICPAVLRTACPAGYHYEFGSTTYDSNRCPVQDAKCVPDAITKCGVNSYRVEHQCDSSSFRTMYVKCQDGYEVTQGVESSCKPASVWEAYAKDVCANRCSSGASITVTSVVPTPAGQIVNTQFSGVPAGWNIRIIGVSGTAQPLPVTSTSFLPVPGSYTGNAVAEYTVPAGGASFAAINVPLSAPGGAYVIEVSDPSSGWLIKLRTPAFNVVGTPTQGITVTAPNGGEQWGVGTMNTITWTPYGYNPDVNPSSDVTAYLVGTLPGSGDQQIVPSGKASIHWEGEVLDEYGRGTTAKPGTYYIRVINKKTGASDQSDRPFTLLAKEIDLKVNGSYGPLFVSKGQSVTISWSTRNVRDCSISYGHAPYIPRVIEGRSVSTSGTMSVVMEGDTAGEISMSCNANESSGRVANAVVSLNQNILPIASLKVTSPNGGEQYKAGGSGGISVFWESTGVTSASVALYKNDQWAEWIAKDVLTYPGSEASTSFPNKYSVVWNPYTRTDLSTSGNVFKVYVTGQKVGGTGYIDDKSDAPFSFVSSTPAPLFDIKADGSNGPVNVAYGSSVVISWTSSGMDSCALTGSGGEVPVSLNGSSNGGTGNGQVIWGLKCKAGANTYTDSVTVNFAPAPLLPVSKVTPTCTYGSSTINIEGGSEACRSWCLSLKAEAGDKAAPPGTSANSCVFKDSNGVSTVVASISTGNVNLANALTALEAALKAILAKLGQ